MMHRFFYLTRALTVSGLVLLAGNALAASIVLADAGPVMHHTSFDSLERVRSGLPAPAAVLPLGPGGAGLHPAPSGHFLPLSRDQARPIPLEHSLAVAAIPPMYHPQPVAQPDDEDDDDEGDANAMKILGGTEKSVSSNKIAPPVNASKQVKQSWPLPSKAQQHFTSAFGMRSDPFTGRPEFHEGIDIAAPAGTTVMASADATVEKAGHGHGFGNYVVLRHSDGMESIYGHMRREVVHTGQNVHRGQKIGEVGSTGRSTAPHLHYQLVRDGRAVNPLASLKLPASVSVASRRVSGTTEVASR